MVNITMDQNVSRAVLAANNVRQQPNAHSVLLQISYYKTGPVYVNLQVG